MDFQSHNCVRSVGTQATRKATETRQVLHRQVLHLHLHRVGRRRRARRASKWCRHFVAFVGWEEVRENPRVSRSRPHLAKPVLAILIWPNLAIFLLTEFGQTAFGQFCFLVGAPRGGGPEGWGPGGVGAPEGWGPRRVGARRGGGPEGWGPGEVGAQNFALFFPSPTGNFVLSSLSGGSSRGILVVFEAQVP